MALSFAIGKELPMAGKFEVHEDQAGQFRLQLGRLGCA